MFQRSIHSVKNSERHNDDFIPGYNIHSVTDVSSPLDKDLVKFVTAQEHTINMLSEVM